MEIQIKQIRSASPTLVGMLHDCLLKAGFACAQNVTQFIIGNPKAWLGTAYHEVLRQLPNINQSLIPEEGIPSLWQQAVKGHYLRALNYPLDRRFGQPESWPGYNLVYFSLIRITYLLENNFLPQAIQESGLNQNTSRTFHEKKFTAFEGKLEGRPDVMLGDKIIDYKSGNIFTNDSMGQSNVINKKYIIQLRIYAFLVKENLGYWPRSGILLPLSGPGIEVNLNPHECEQEAIGAVSLLEFYNRSLTFSEDPLNIASPSKHTCKWCSYQLICPAFWQYVQPDWSDDLGEAAFEGSLINQIQPKMAGTVYSLSLHVLHSSLPLADVVAVPINSSSGKQNKNGDLIRIVGLGRRQNGSVIPTIRTVMHKSSELPPVMIIYAQENHQ